MRSLIHMAVLEMNRFNKSLDIWEERILKKWAESKKYPRKKKKQVRKILLLEYSIAQWGKDLYKWQ